jgi:hypothetical protein
VRHVRVRWAAIYFHTTSVGGVNSELQYYKRAAAAGGDVFHILRSKNLINAGQGLYPHVTRKRGGDTYIDLDGWAGHHPDQTEKTLKWLKKNYDALFFISLCPHPNKLYGNNPDFLPLYTDTPTLPKAATLCDGYWSTYAEWARMAVPHVQALYTGCAAYALPAASEGINVIVRPRPFAPLANYKTPQSREMLTAWTSQWKQIKGINKFLKVIPKINGIIELYSTGIEYYKMRTTELWKAAVDRDHVFPEFSGHGKAQYYGWVPLDRTPEIYQRAWFSVNLQGITAKTVKTSLFGNTVNDPRAVYAAGSYNNTETEALYFGAVPVLHEQVLKSDLPKDLILTVRSAEELPDLLNLRESQKFARDEARRVKAREFVTEHNSPARIYREMKRRLGF